MEKIWVIFDGSNFYHLLKTLPSVYSPSSFNYIKFVKFLAKNEKINRKIYCIGAVREETGNIKSKKLMIQQQKFLAFLKKENFEIHLGYILKKNGYHEKGVDVKIATEILIGAFYNLYDILYLVSSDTDLIPTIKEAIKLNKKIVYVGFSKKPSYAMIKNCSDSLLLDEIRLKEFFK